MVLKFKDLKRVYVLQGRQLQVKDFSLSYKSEQIDQFFVAFAEARTKQLTGEMLDCYNNSWLQFFGSVYVDVSALQTFFGNRSTIRGEKPRPKRIMHINHLLIC